METKTLQNYEILKILGKGSYGTVYEAKRDTDGKIIALKVITLDSSKEDKLENTKKEIEFLQKLSDPICNPFIICYYGSYHDKTNNRFLIEMEYIKGMDMKGFVNYINTNNNKDVLYYYLLLIAKDLAEGLKYIHSKNILHNDIKLENIMIDGKYTPRIIDFGLSCFTVKSENKDNICYSRGGTAMYVPPEFIQKGERTPATDMWALGITLYRAATGEFPFEGKTVRELYLDITGNDFDINTTPQLDDIITCLLDKDPEKRCTADDLIMKLEIINNKPEIKAKIPSIFERLKKIDNKN